MNKDVPFNDLSPAQAERLAILAEECAEVIQIIGKILRHGYESTHPDNEVGPNNREMLEAELGHVLAAQRLMAKYRDVEMFKINNESGWKLEKIQHYLHHNTV